MNDQFSYQEHILIIDDTPDVVGAIVIFLTKSGFKVTVAYGGLQGIKMAHTLNPHLILLDVMMPDVDGFEVCRILKSQEETKYIPIIFMTALADTIGKIEGFSLGASDYVTKPVHHEELLARMTTHLTIRKQYQQLQEELQFRREMEYSLRDTASKLMEQAVELESRNMELDAFAHVIVYGLRDPLYNMTNYVEHLRKNSTLAISNEILTELQSIARMSTQAAVVVDTLLLSIKISRQSFDIYPLDMTTVVKQVIHVRLAQMIKKQRAKVKVPHVWPAAWGNEVWLQEIWSNYVSNALKYGGTPPCLELGATPQSNGIIRFWVKDNGNGLTPEEQAQLFIPFTRFHSQQIEGVGLGLAIVQQIVRRLGGQVGVKSVVGEGSLFYFTLRGAS